MRYAFGRGLDPRKKDGVRAHPLVLACGMLLHVAIAGALTRLVILLTGIALPTSVQIVLASVLIAGFLGGAALIVRRLRSPVLRVVSTVDDYTSAALVLAFLAVAEATLVTPRAGMSFYAVSLALAGYAPFGKIRHCVLFFITRFHFGIFVGRRGVLGVRPDGA